MLRALCEEAIALAGAQSITREAVENWRARTLAALEEAYGAESSQLRDFSQIRFDDATITGAAERVLKQKAAEAGIELPNIRLPREDESLRQGLYEAADLLLSLIA